MKKNNYFNGVKALVKQAIVGTVFLSVLQRIVLVSPCTPYFIRR
jgi:hypothetical protein